MSYATFLSSKLIYFCQLSWVFMRIMTNLNSQVTDNWISFKVYVVWAAINLHKSLLIAWRNNDVKHKLETWRFELAELSLNEA